MAQKRILVEAFKLSEGQKDGIFRYTSELFKGLLRQQEKQPLEFDIKILVGGTALPLGEARTVLQSSQRKYERQRARIDGVARLRQRLADSISSRTPSLAGRLKKLDKHLQVTSKLEEAHVGALAYEGDYDLVHLTLPQAYKLIEAQQTTRTLVTIHDCTHRLFPEFHTWENVDACEKGLEFALARDADFITVSESARRDLLGFYDIAPDRVTPIHLGRDPLTFHREKDPGVLRKTRKKFRIPGQAPYFLTLSTIEPRKNLMGALKAFRSLLKRHPDTDAHLVVAGKLGWKYDDLLEEVGSQRERLIFTDFVPEADLAPLYSGALAFCFASHYEGFGLPALEAMSCGIPVIYGNRGSLPEVVGEGGIGVDPEDVSAISDSMSTLLKDPQRRESIAARALERAGRFSWDKTTSRTLDVYRSILG